MKILPAVMEPPPRRRRRRHRPKKAGDPELLEVERSLWEYLETILNVLRSYRAIPLRASGNCRCTPPINQLPRWLARQCRELRFDDAMSARFG